MDNFLDECLEYDVTMGSDLIKCPHCGTRVSRSLLLGEDVKCPGCGGLLKDE